MSPELARLLGDLLEILERRDLVLGLAVVERDRQPLVLHGPVDAGGERVDLVAPAVGLRRELEAVGAHVADALDADHAPGVLSRPPADAGDEGVAAREPGDLGASLVRHARVLGTGRDGRQSPVDVEQDRRQLGSLREPFDRRHGSYDTGVRFVAIGLAAGFFSALFGVGGGIVVVPLLILAAGFEERSAMATSLASIGLIAFAGTVSYALRGDVDFGYGLLLGLPAALGAIGGTALQQRVAGPVLSYAFAGLARRDRGLAARLMLDVVVAIVIGVLAGALGGLFGVGGGLIFVPALVLLFGFGQVEAEATSLLAIIPVVVAGTWRQHLYGNVRWRAALVIGVVAVAGVELGVLTAKSLSGGDAPAPVRLAAPRRGRAAGLAGQANIIIRRDDAGDLWLPLVDEPIRAIVSEIEAEDPACASSSPRRKSSSPSEPSRTSASGSFGRLLMEEEVEAYDGSETWVRACCGTPSTGGRSLPRCRRSRKSSPPPGRRGPRPRRRYARPFRDFARRELGD